MTTNYHPAELASILESIESLLVGKAAPAILPGLRRKAEAEIERRAASAFRALPGAIDERRLAKAIRERDIDAALAELPFDEVLARRFKGDVNGAVRDTYVAAGERAVALLKAKLVRKDVSFAVRVANAVFDVIDPRGLEALRRHGAELVTEITESSRLAMRELLSSMFEAGVSVTGQVARIKESIGMHSRHVTAVENLRERLTTLGVDPVKVARKVAAKARELHRLRALSIARYESGWAAGAGQQEAWQQALDDDLITADAKRAWRTAGDDVVRDEHVEMEGQKVGLNEQFELPGGESIDFPPTDPGCRCSVDIEP